MAKTDGGLQLSNRLMIRLEAWQREQLKEEAAKQGLADSTLARVWIVQKLTEDTSK